MDGSVHTSKTGIHFSRLLRQSALRKLQYTFAHNHIDLESADGYGMEK